MNDDNKILDQAQPQTPVQPVSSAGGTNKEVGRVVTPVSEFVRPSGVEIAPNIAPEVAEANVVEVKNDNPNLTPEHHEAGIRYSGPSVPLLAEPSGLVQSPLTPEEMVKTSKTNPANSIRWLREIINKTFNKIRLKKE